LANSHTVNACESKQGNPVPAVADLTGRLPCERFRFTIKIQSSTILPLYKGGVFRDAFGNAFRKSVCAMKQVKDCDTCMLKRQCLYIALFRPPPPEGFKDAAKYNNAPPPYVLNPPLDNRQSFYPGDILTFDLVLIGRAIDAIPYFIYSFIEMGKMGIGRRNKKGERGRYELTGVDHLKADMAVRIYDNKTEILKSFNKISELPPICEEDIQSLTIKFLTPLRLKQKGRLATRLTFPLLFNRIIHRLELLSEFYGANGRIHVAERCRGNKNHQ
jgi:hypothetical protein